MYAINVMPILKESKGAVDERLAIGCHDLISGVGGVATWESRQDMITRSTAHIESQSRECPASMSWCLLGWLGEMIDGKNKTAIGKGGVVWRRQAQVLIKPHEARRWIADSEPAARCVGWRGHMACMLGTTFTTSRRSKDSSI